MHRLKFLIFFLFLGISICSFSQRKESISIYISDIETKDVIPFATIHLLNNPSIGWAANLQGIIQIESSQLEIIQNDSLLIKSLGYEQKTIFLRQIESSNFYVYLHPQTFSLNEVIIRPSEDLAIKTIKNAIAHRKENSPASLAFFSCEKYNKTIIDFVPNEDFLSNTEIEKIRTKQQQKHLLISEKYSTHTFQQGTIVSESIKSYRLSGFREPSIENFTSQIQPFHFYDPIITLFENTYINPISKSGISNYGYQIIDAIYTETDTLIAIEYFPKTINKSLLKGIVHISMKNYAIANVTAEPVIQELLSLKIEQEYINTNNHYLPYKLNYLLTFKKYPSKKYGLKLESYTHIKNYSFNTLEVHPIINPNSLLPIDNLRSFKLTSKEQNTYKWADSIGLVKNFDGKLKFINKLSQGKIPFKIFDFDLSQNQYNLHEKFRFGIGVYANEGFSKRFTIGGFVAYGTDDKKTKYGGLIKYKFTKQKIEIEGTYKTDLVERGILDIGFNRKPDFWRNMMKDSLNSVESFSLSIQKKINNSSFLFGAKKEHIQDLYFTSEKLNFTEIYASAKINLNKKEQQFYEPNNLSYKFPILYFTYIKGTNMWEGDFAYTRLTFSLDYTYYIERLGKQSIYITYDKLFNSADLPYYKLISAYGAYTPSLPFYAKNYFQTMHPYEFSHTESLVMHLKHTFLKPLFYSKISEPRISLIQSLGWGKNNLRESPQIRTFDKGYFESGINIENLLKINYINFAYIGMGAGIFTTYGDKASGNTIDNFVIKVNVSVIF